MYKLVAIAVALALFAVPGALAAHGEDESLAGTGAVTGEVGLNIDGDGNLWDESNDEVGLQTADLLDEETGEVIHAGDAELF